jgi:hypothetical protein
VTGSFDRARIGGGALDWLKAGESADEIAKQAEIAFSKLPTILSSRKLSRPADTP